MKKSLQTGFCISFLLLTSTYLFGQKANPDFYDLKNLKWLVGTWQSDNNLEENYEEWNWINDTLLQGKSFIVKNNDTILIEKISITKTKNGIFYIAEVADQNNGEAVYFKLSKATKNNIYTFENNSHDFPNSINYMQINTKTLLAWIEGKGKRFDFKMKKIK